MKITTRHLIIATVLASSPLSALADGNFYLGASIGAASLNDDFDGFDIDSSSTAFRVVAGWQFNDYFSLEGGYHNFGEFEQRLDVGGEAADVSLKADGFLLGGTGSIPLGEKFALYARAGAFFWDGDADINNVTEARPENTNLYIGAGARFAFSDRFALVGDWVSYSLEDVQSGVTSVGVVISF